MVAVGRVSSFRAVDRFDEATTYIRDIGEAEIKRTFRRCHCIAFINLCRDCSLRKLRSEKMYQ